MTDDIVDDNADSGANIAPTAGDAAVAGKNGNAIGGGNNGGKQQQGGGGGGIAWQSGSSVGALNPTNFGYRYSTPSKRYRTATTSGGPDDANRNRELPANLQVRFRNRQGAELGGSAAGGSTTLLDLPVTSSVDDMTSLVHALLDDELRDADHDATSNKRSKIPYSFYAKIKNNDEKDGPEDDVEITASIAELLLRFPHVGTETTLEITYQPLSVFRVRPVARCTDTLPGHSEAVLHVCYSPDGKWLLSGGGDFVVRIWDVNTGTAKHICKGIHRHHVLATSWSPDASRFVSGDKNGVLVVWDPVTGKSVGKALRAHKQWITGIAWEPMHLVPASKVATFAASNTSGKIDISTTVCDRLATSSKDGTVKIWNVRTQVTSATLSGHADSVEAVKWGGEGFVYSASRDRTIKVWNPDRGILVRTLVGHGHRVNTLALSSDFVLRTGPFDYKRTKFESVKEAYESACEKYDHFRKHHQDGNGNGDSGGERLVSGSDDFTLYVWNPAQSKHPLKRLTGHQQAVNHIAFSPDGRYFASASFDKKVKVWNGYSGDFLITLTGHVGSVYQVAWSGDSRYLVSASKDSTAKLWEVPSGGAGKRSGTARETLPGHADEVYALDWCPFGGSVATGSKDRTIKIWKH